MEIDREYDLEVENRRKELEELAEDDANKVRDVIVAAILLYGAGFPSSKLLDTNKQKEFNKYIQNELKTTLKTNANWEEGIFISVFDRIARNQNNNIDYYAKWVGNKTFRDRILANREKIAKYIEKSVKKNIKKDTENLLSIVEEASKSTKKKQINHSLALLRTETNRIVNRRELLDMIYKGYKKYVYCAIIDGRTSAICRSLDGNVYNINEYMEGETAPPMHTNCRSYIIGDE